MSDSDQPQITGAGRNYRYVFPIAGGSWDDVQQRKLVTTGFHATNFAFPKGDHPGIDLGYPAGSQIVSPVDGTLLGARFREGGFGNVAVIQGDDGRTYLLEHQAAFAPGLKQGQRLSAGQPVGLVGQTGKADGPHLHFEVQENGQPVDPVSYLQRAEKGPTTMAGNQVTDARQSRVDRLQQHLDEIRLLQEYVDVGKTIPAKTWLGSKNLTPDQWNALKLRVGIDPDNPPTNPATKQPFTLPELRAALGNLESNTARDLETAQIAVQDKAATATKEPRVAATGPYHLGPNGEVINTQTGEVVQQPTAKPDKAASQGPYRLGANGTVINTQTGEVTQPGTANAGRAPSGYAIDPETGQLAPTTAIASRELTGYYTSAGKAKEAEAEQYQQAAALNKAKIALLQQAQQEVQAALALPEGDQRRQALEQATLKYSAINDPGAALTYFDSQAKQQLERQRAQQEAIQRAAELQTQRHGAFNTAMGQFEQSGVATAGRVAGLQAMRRPLSPETYATMLGIDANDPRAHAISQAAAALFGAPSTSGQPAAQVAGAAAPTPANAPPSTGDDTVHLDPNLHPLSPEEQAAAMARAKELAVGIPQDSALVAAMNPARWGHTPDNPLVPAPQAGTDQGGGMPPAGRPKTAMVIHPVAHRLAGLLLAADATPTTATKASVAVAAPP